MEFYATFTISAVELLRYDFDLLSEICYGIFNMAADNELGDEISEAVLNICNDDSNQANRLSGYITYSEDDLIAVDTRQVTNADIMVEYQIPVTLNV
jgi:hypothetical protein